MKWRAQLVRAANDCLTKSKATPAEFYFVKWD